MAKAVRRQTAAQRTATLFGGALLVLLILAAAFMFVQGNRVTVSDSPMQRVISAPVSSHFYVFETAQVRDGTMYITGHYAGIPSSRPEDAAAWQTHTEELAKIFAGELKGLNISAVHVQQSFQGTVMAEATAQVR